MNNKIPTDLPALPPAPKAAHRHMAGLVLAAALALPLGCGGDFGSYGGGGDFGATPGGVQDMGLARQLIAEGKVPPAEAFLVEGMFSEHELGLEGEPCSTLLCLRSAAGFAPTLDGEPSGWVQVGLSSTIDPETFVRPSQTLIFTVDVSGSMGWGYGDGEYPSPGTLARELLHSLVDQLGEQDRVAIVTYGSDVQTVLSLTNAGDKTRIHRAIDALSTNGSTNMEAGLSRAFALAEDTINITDETRVMLFTDAQPNVGATSASQFETMAAAAADNGVGLTVYGLGLGLGQEVMAGMSHLRGGNAFSLFQAGDVDTLMDDHWPWMVSPIAYDLSVKVAPTIGHVVADTYGFPGSTPEEASLEVATVFLSKKKGALLVRLERGDGEPMGSFDAYTHLRYTTPIGQPIEASPLTGFSDASIDERGQYFSQHAVGKSTALAIAVDAWQRAAELYASDRTAAIELAAAARDRLSDDALYLADPTITVELELAIRLHELMQQGAEQGTFYGSY